MGSTRATAAPSTTGPALLWPTAVILAGAVMSSLSGSALNTALPELTEVFHTTPATVAWVVIAQSLANATLLTVFGRLSDMTGRRRMYLAGLALSVVASALCGLSNSIGLLILFRAAFGIGAAMVAANSLAYLVGIYPVARRGFLVGLWEAGIATGMALGPVAGGLVLAALGWRAIFFIYTGIGLVLLPLVLRSMHEEGQHRAGERFDLPGALLFAGAVAPVMLVLSQGRALGWLSPPVLAAVALGLASLAAFIAVERRTAQPMVRLDLFGSRGFSAGNLAKVSAYFGFSATTFLLPFYWDRELGLPPDRLGLALTAFPIGMLLGSVGAGPLSDRIGTRLLAPGGLLLMVAAALAQTRVSGEMGVLPVLAAAWLAGLGVGAFIAPNDSAILAVTPPDRIGVANGIMGVSRSLGLLFGQAVAAELLTVRLAANGGAFLPSYHQVFLLVTAVILTGIPLAAVRDRGVREGRGLHH